MAANDPAEPVRWWQAYRMREAKMGLLGEDEREDERRGEKGDEAKRGRVEKVGAY